MKARTNKKDKINVVTLGCSKNLVDSEVLLTQLKANNKDAYHERQKDDANIIIVNTCGFIDNAKQESIDTILRYAEAKEEGKIDKLFVTGCLSHRYKDDLEKEIGNVDDWFGTMHLPQLLKALKADYKKELLGERLTTTANHYAYLKISEGCDRPCSFCAIPLMRGNHRSRSIEDLVLETKNLVKNGAKEILLIAQDSTYYGLDLYKERALAKLLDTLADIDGLEWLRLHYAFPTGFPKDALKVIAERPNICNYLDMPLQHGSSNMLKLMRRGTTRDKTERLIDEIRSTIPDLTLRTTLIAGHPGETEADFADMVDFVEKTKFDRLGIFTYSHEEQTHAYSMEDNIPQEVKQERADIVMGIQEEISLEKNQAKVGTIQKVLIDRIEGDHFIGRTEADSPEVDNEVLISSDDYYCAPGQFVNVKINKAGPFDLYGEPVQ